MLCNSSPRIQVLSPSSTRLAWRRPWSASTTAGPPQPHLAAHANPLTQLCLTQPVSAFRQTAVMLLSSKPQLKFFHTHYVFLIRATCLTFPPSASQMKLQGDRNTPGRQSVSAVEMTSQRRSSISSQVCCNISKYSNCVWGLYGISEGLCILNRLHAFFLSCSAVYELPKYWAEHGTIHCFTTAATTTTSSDKQPSTIHIWLVLNWT